MYVTEVCNFSVGKFKRMSHSSRGIRRGAGVWNASVGRAIGGVKPIALISVENQGEWGWGGRGRDRDGREKRRARG